jgi:hypothetical protein
VVRESITRESVWRQKGQCTWTLLPVELGPHEAAGCGQNWGLSGDNVWVTGASLCTTCGGMTTV